MFMRHVASAKIDTLVRLFAFGKIPVKRLWNGRKIDSIGVGVRMGVEERGAVGAASSERDEA